MQSCYSFQVPAAPENLFDDGVTADAIQQHWLRTFAQLQQNWLDNGRSLIDCFQAWTQGGQNVQGLMFGPYLDWLGYWAGVPTAAAGSPGEKPAPAAPQAGRTVRTEEKGGQARKPRLIGWVVDDLTRIQGIGKVLQQRLYEEGIVTYRQIAAWDQADIDRIEKEVLGSRFAGRVSRERWQAQASALIED